MNTQPIIMGIEKEYAAAGQAGGKRLSGPRITEALLGSACKLYPHARGGRSNGIWLANASRFYIDCGDHPEWTTPEVHSPHDAVRYERAQDRMIHRAAMEAGLPQEISLFANNVDYLSRTTWGFHESYLHSCPQSELPSQLVPLLVSRIVLTGAGGFHPFQPVPAFVLSPRAMFLSQVVSSESTCNRGIFHTKDESLANAGHHRLHVICGESVQSDAAAFLRVGLLALAVALIDGGRKPGEGVRFRDPVQAMRAFASDSLCAVAAPCEDGSSRTAIDVLRHYLDVARRNAAEPFMPPYTLEVVALAESLLQQIQCSTAPLPLTLNWVIKRMIFDEYIRGRGYDWPLLGRWSRVFARFVEQPADDEADDGPRLDPLARIAQKPDGRTAGRMMKSVYPELDQLGLSWDQVPDLHRLRTELHELDWRFAQLGPAGLFAALDAAGALNHRVPGVDRLDEAVASPPSYGRAHVRGTLIGGHPGAHELRCDWTALWDIGRRLHADLTDPYITNTQAVQWKPFEQVDLEGVRVGRRFAHPAAPAALPTASAPGPAPAPRGG